MKIELFGKGWSGKDQLLIFDKPVGTGVFDNNTLFLNGKKIRTDRPLGILERFVKKNRLYAVGFISYDFKRYIFKEFNPKKRDIGLPLVFFVFFRNFRYGVVDLPGDKPVVKSIGFSTDKGRFIKMVERAKKYIEDGDIYQINLSHRIEVEGFFNTDRVFRELIIHQPAPYLMHIKTPDFSIVSGSMELFLEKKGKELKSIPIKGTRKTGNNEKETEQLVEELESSPKERAENLMITDLMRNDLGRISEKGSVVVERLFDIKKYRTVLQMESVVKSVLKGGISLNKIIQSTFPPGSVTGAPKKRAVEIIDILERHRREVYCGATVFIKPDGDFVMSVAIRQSIFKRNKCYIYVGSGIVADSDPEKEYEETLIKAKANLKAIGLDF